MHSHAVVVVLLFSILLLYIQSDPLIFTVHFSNVYCTKRYCNLPHRIKILQLKIMCQLDYLILIIICLKIAPNTPLLGFVYYQASMKFIN